MSRRQLLLDAGQFEVLSPEPPGGAYGAGGAYGEGGYGGERGGYGADAKFVGDLTYYGGAQGWSLHPRGCFWDHDVKNRFENSIFDLCTVAYL